MPFVQIPNLPAAISLNGTELMEAVQSGASVRVTVQQIADFTIFYLSPSSTPLPAGENHIGQVGGQGPVLQAADSALTRPNNVTGYSANQGVGSSSSCIFKFTDFFRIEGNTGLLTGMKLTAAASGIGVANMPIIEAHIYKSEPSSPPASDQQTANLLATNSAIELGVVSFTEWNIGGGSSNMIDSYGQMAINPLPICAASDAKDLWAVLVTTSTATPIAQTVILPYASMLED